MTHGDRRRVFGLDCLRALAILSVLFAHGFGLLYPQMPAWFGLLGHGGFYGVELFFVLSGFLIGRILIRYDSDLGNPGTVGVFYIRRWFRTLPLFWLFVVLNVLLEFQVKDHPVSLGEVLEHGFFLRTFATYHPVFFPESWSLAIEEWFYLLFPAAIWLGLRFQRRFAPVFLTVAAAFFLFSTIGRMISAYGPDASWAQWQRVIVIYRFDGLMIGVFAGWISLRWPEFWQARPRLSAAIGCPLALRALLLRYGDGGTGNSFSDRMIILPALFASLSCRSALPFFCRGRRFGNSKMRILPASRCARLPSGPMRFTSSISRSFSS